MKTIWKFSLKVLDEQVVSMPEGARVLCVQMQNGTPCLWAEVPRGVKSAPSVFHIYGTDHPLPDDPGTYIGTVQDGSLVWHVYQGGKEFKV